MSPRRDRRHGQGGHRRRGEAAGASWTAEKRRAGTADIASHADARRGAQAAGGHAEHPDSQGRGRGQAPAAPRPRGLPAGLGAGRARAASWPRCWRSTTAPGRRRSPAEDEYPEVPVRLKNNRFTRALNMVTEMYSLPAYDGVDPNPLMAPFFILFYGIMLADMGYGVLMVIAACGDPGQGQAPQAACATSLSCCSGAAYPPPSGAAITGGCFADCPAAGGQDNQPGHDLAGACPPCSRR